MKPFFHPEETVIQPKSTELVITNNEGKLR